MDFISLNKFSNQIAFKKYYDESFNWNNSEFYRYEIPIDESFFKEFSNKIQWKILIKYHQLSEANLKKYAHYFFIDDLIKEQTLSELFIEDHIKLFDEKSWELISIHQKLSEDFIKKYQNKVHWYYISMYQVLSEDFIEEFYDKVNWKEICIKQKLSEDFIEYYYDLVDWSKIIEFQDISLDFVLKNQNRFNNFELKKYFQKQKKLHKK